MNLVADAASVGHGRSGRKIRPELPQAVSFAEEFQSPRPADDADWGLAETTGDGFAREEKE